MTSFKLQLDYSPMKNRNTNLIFYGWGRFSIFLIVAYFSQIYPYYYLSHNHRDGLLEIEISFHAFEIDIEHAAEHDHDGNAPHPDEHQHVYEMSINRHSVKSQIPKLLKSAEQYLLSSISFNYINDLNLVYFEYKEYPGTSNYLGSSIVRGPPISGQII